MLVKENPKKKKKKKKYFEKAIKINLFVIYGASQNGREFSKTEGIEIIKKICDGKSYENS